MRLRVRIAGLLAGLVVLNVAFVAALLRAYGVVVPTLVAGVFLGIGASQLAADLVRFPVSWPVFLVIVVAEMVGRLTTTADVPTPTVRVGDDRRLDLVDDGPRRLGGACDLHFQRRRRPEV